MNKTKLVDGTYRDGGPSLHLTIHKLETVIPRFCVQGSEAEYSHHLGFHFHANMRQLRQLRDKLTGYIAAYEDYQKEAKEIDPNE